MSTIVLCLCYFRVRPCSDWLNKIQRRFALNDSDGSFRSRECDSSDSGHPRSYSVFSSTVFRFWSGSRLIFIFFFMILCRRNSHLINMMANDIIDYLLAMGFHGSFAVRIFLYSDFLALRLIVKITDYIDNCLLWTVVKK